MPLFAAGVECKRHAARESYAVSGYVGRCRATSLVRKRKHRDLAELTTIDGCQHVASQLALLLSERLGTRAAGSAVIGGRARQNRRQ